MNSITEVIDALTRLVGHHFDSVRLSRRLVLKVIVTALASHAAGRGRAVDIDLTNGDLEM